MCRIRQYFVEGNGWVVKATDCKSVGKPSLVRIQLTLKLVISLKNALKECLKFRLYVIFKGIVEALKKINYNFIRLKYL